MEKDKKSSERLSMQTTENNEKKRSEIMQLEVTKI